MVDNSDFTSIFRPRNEKQLLGSKQKTSLSALLSSIEKNEPFRKIMLIGPSGVGKTTIGLIYCSNLLGLEDGENPMDYIEYVNCGSETGIDYYRGLVDRFSNFPILADYRIIYMDEVHKLSPQSQESLLTPIENLPSHVVIISSTTEPHKLKATLKSRFKQFVLDMPNREDFLTKAGWYSAKFEKELDKRIIDEIIDRSSGNMRTFDTFMQDLVNGSYVSDNQNPEDDDLVRALLFDRTPLHDIFKIADKEESYAGTTVRLCRASITTVIKSNGRAGEVTNKALSIIKIFGQGLSPNMDEKSSFYGKLIEYWIELHNN